MTQNDLVVVGIEYAKGNISLGFLKRRYPFLAKEVERQGLDGKLAELFSL
jgi:hypothetical protein